MTKEEILKECKKRYPVGTMINTLYHEGCAPMIIADNDFNHCREDGIHVNSEHGYLMAVVYENGVWAEIITNKIELNYPIY
jgi:hypothetical protein